MHINTYQQYNSYNLCAIPEVFALLKLMWINQVSVGDEQRMMMVNATWQTMCAMHTIYLYTE